MIGLTPIEELTWKVLQLENDLKALRQDADQRNAASKTTRQGTTTPPPGLTSSEVLALIKRAFIYEELITTTGTSHNTTFNVALAPDGTTPLIFMELDGVVMRRGGTGNRGWTFTNPNSITTVRSIVATDKLMARYVKANP